MKKKNHWIRGIIAAPVCAAALILAGCALESEHSPLPPPPPPPKNMVLVRGGSFQMGNNNGWVDEKPVHRVTLKSFYLGIHPVTQKEWFEIMGDTPSHFKGDDLPVESVSWFDAVAYCNTLSQNEGLTPAYTITGSEDTEESVSCDWNANGYRLPTEAEWEYAARGGNGSPGNYTYSGSNGVNAVAWYEDNSGGTTHPVGSKMPNALGLYDMSGNVYEWCWDWEGNYSGEGQTNPRGPSSGDYRVSRGGCYREGATYARSTERWGSHSPYGWHQNRGFRIARPIGN